MNRAQQMEKIVGDHAHLEPGLVRLETPAARLVPPQRILALFDPVFDLCPAVVDLHHLRRLEPGVGHDEPNPGEHPS